MQVKKKKKKTARSTRSGKPQKKTIRKKSGAGKSKSVSRLRKRSKGASRKRRVWIKYSAVALVIGFAAYVVYLDITIREQFTGRRWALPAHVYARPLELYEGADISPDKLLSELKTLGYQSGPLERTGTFVHEGDQVHLHARSFTFWDGPRPATRLTIEFEHERINAMRHAGKRLETFRLEPGLFGSVLPNRHEDRSLVRLQDVPTQLIHALLSVEDRNYYQHIGIDPRGLARALWVNLTAGDVVQGGSTITQQLVKNFYLSAERTVSRKFNEMIMALLLELHYSKQEILETYINEVYLGQAGNRAIHGFGLASRFYFGRPLSELNLAESALLVALIKGPSFYNPLRHPQRARTRRDLVLSKMVELGYLQPAQAAKARSTDLDVVKQANINATPYPAFMDLARWQLQRDYRPQDLSEEGLRIFTTLDPMIQQRAQATAARRLANIERARKIPVNTLQAAAIVIRTDNGEVQALVGSRRGSIAGFNRALLARRPIGSLIKPALYLAALEQPQRYTLASRLRDTPLAVRQPGAPEWRPQNYDRLSHGEVLLVDALVHSYNLASVRLGMDVGVPAVVSVLQRLGLRRSVEPYPSLLLGSIELTPVEVSQLYLTLAGGGFRTPIRAVREVMTHDAQPLARYPLNIEQVIDPEPMVLLNYALNQVVQRGTAAALYKRFPADLKLAAKTGTTDEFRDSWFAGYSGNYLTIVWIGRDDNKPTGLSGATGAMLLWADIMQELHLRPVPTTQTPQIEYAIVNPKYGAGCESGGSMPFIKGSVPGDATGCDASVSSRTVPQSKNRLMRWIKDLFR